MGFYSSQAIEKKWQEFWTKNNTFVIDLNNKNKPKKYILAMFPYPSGSGLHVGHVRNYTIADVIARFYRLKGYNVLFPIGWDAFGLPAEQYAIQTNNHPAIFTQQNIAKFKQQLQKFGFSYDWTKEIDTSDSKYYKLTQWIFSQIYKQNLAEYREEPVYWCQKLGTVLSNEEIKLINGRKVSERGEFPVIKKNIYQWVLKITNYASLLLEDLENLDWPKSIKLLQKNWIGLSKGFVINFSLIKNKNIISVFTTRVDTIYGVTCITLSINHPLIKEITLENYKQKVFDFCNYWKEIEDREKEENLGVFTGCYGINPITKERIPIWISNFVIDGYGTSSIMISPYFSGNEIWEIFISNDLLINKFEKKNNEKIDFNFSKKYNLLKKEGIFSINSKKRYFYNCFCGNNEENNCLEKHNFLLKEINNKKKAIEIISNFLEQEKKGYFAQFYHLKDWVFSRQRYWGEPIPVIHLENGEKELLSIDELPLMLPYLKDFAPDSNFFSPLQKKEEWINVVRGSLKGKRDFNVMPQWAGSCFYYLAFLLKKENDYLTFNSKEAKELIKIWEPVDIYIGGQEHANLHLLYSRFWHKVLYQLGIVSKSEPFQKLICQGMILGEDGEKMSKSKGNIIDPNKLIEKYSADALRLYVIFIGPIIQSTSFKIEGVKAMQKWLYRIYELFINQKNKFTENETNNSKLKNSYLEMIQKVNKYYLEYKFNLIISCFMIFINQCYKNSNIPNYYVLDFCTLLSPLAPHIAAEIQNCWKIENNYWPEVKEDNKIFSLLNIIVQINGKKKFIINLNKNFNEKEIIEIIKKDLRLTKLFLQYKIIKTIFIKNKLVNFVIEKL